MVALQSLLLLIGIQTHEYDNNYDSINFVFSLLLLYLMMLKCFSINLVEDIASEMHNMNVSAKMLSEIQRNFNNDPVSAFSGFCFAWAWVIEQFRQLMCKQLCYGILHCVSKNKTLFLRATA